jgi:hypothetical protein
VTSRTSGLRCRLCGHTIGAAPVHVCEECFGPLEIVYDSAAQQASISRAHIEARPPNLWRYRELLPLDGEPRVGRDVGFTPLVPAPRLGRELGIDDLWIKNDAVNHPTLSFKDRVVAIAVKPRTRVRSHGGRLCTRLTTLDDEVAARCAETHAAGRRLIYLGRVDRTGASVRLAAIGPDHPGWTLCGTENLVAIVSDRYAHLPLVVRGPGAGPDVTAAGLLADILRAQAETHDRPLCAVPGHRQPAEQTVDLLPPWTDTAPVVVTAAAAQR